MIQLVTHRGLSSSALLVCLLAGCSTLTPEQSAGLREAQRLADGVTAAYGLGPVRVYPYDRLPAHAAAGYDYQHDWILISPATLEREHLQVVVSHELGHLTLGHRAARPTSDLELFIRRRNELEANHRAVEIMVRFLGVTEREAAHRYADYLVMASRAYRGHAGRLPRTHFHPCIQLRDLWRRLAYAESSPACEED